MSRAGALVLRTGKIAMILALATAPAACAAFGKKQPAPEWFKTRVAELNKKQYPLLSAVPQPTPVKSAAEWQGVQTEVAEAGALLNASPRSAPVAAGAAPAATGEFEAKARRAVEIARPE